MSEADDQLILNHSSLARHSQEQASEPPKVLYKNVGHRIYVGSRSGLYVTYRHRTVATFIESAAPWAQLRYIENGSDLLAKYFDDSAKRGTLKPGRQQQKEYLKLAKRWIARNLPPDIAGKVKSVRVSARSLVRSDQKRELESKKATSDGVIESYHTTMSKIEDRLSTYGARRPTIIRAIVRLIDTVEQRFTEMSQSDKADCIVNHLDQAISSVNSLSSTNHQPQVTLPFTAPTQYIPRVSGKASDFLGEHYGSYIEAGVCFRPDIKRLDPKLEMALANEFRGRTDKLRAILPNQSDATDARLEAEFGAPIRPDDRKAAIIASSVAKRVKTSTP